MHAADVVEALPTARPDDEVLSVARTVSRDRLPGLAVVDERGLVLACVSSVDLLRLALPRYLAEDPTLARVFAEPNADRICRGLSGRPILEALAEVAGRVPVARADATIIELAELMARESCALVLVRTDDGRTLGIVTANRLLAVLAEEPA